MQAGQDDASFLGSAIKIDAWALGCCWAQWARFFIERKDILLATLCLITINIII